MILVTGGEGFVGSHIVENIENAVPLDDRSYNKCIFDNTIVMDIRSSDIWDVIKESDFIIHSACRDIRTSMVKPIEDADVNVIGTLNILKACREFKKPILYISSVSVHAEASHYAISKRAGERYAMLYRQWIPTTIVRLSNVFGLRDQASVIGKWLKNDEITLIEGEQTRDFTYIEDSIAGILNAIEKKPLDIVDIGTGIQTSLEDAALWLSKRLNKKIVKIPAREIDNVKKRAVEVENMKKYLGIQAKWNFYDALEKLIELTDLK